MSRDFTLRGPNDESPNTFAKKGGRGTTTGRAGGGNNTGAGMIVQLDQAVRDANDKKSILEKASGNNEQLSNGQCLSLLQLNCANNPCVRKPLYRTMVMAKFPNIKALDHQQLSEEERNRMQSVFMGNSGGNNNTGNNAQSNNNSAQNHNSHNNNNQNDPATTRRESNAKLTAMLAGVQSPAVQNQNLDYNTNTKSVSATAAALAAAREQHRESLARERNSIASPNNQMHDSNGSNNRNNSVLSNAQTQQQNLVLYTL